MQRAIGVWISFKRSGQQNFELMIPCAHQFSFIWI